MSGTPYSEREARAARLLKDLREEEARPPAGQPEIPRYEIRRRLGEGATAIVFGAWDRELRRPVALKVLREGSEWSEVQRQRFHREAQAAACVSHPNLVTVYDAGEAQGRPFLVMELVEGKLLSDVFKEQSLAPRELLQLLEKVCRGVAAAHAKGIVHRDLKPANVLISASGEPKVGDFGLAHLLESSVQLTRTGTSLGTPLYMSPEQVRGQSKEITPRTDVYGLGAVIYEAVTGRPPHIGETLQEVYAKIVEEEPARPRNLRPEVSSDVETIVLKALDKNPRERYPTAEALADDLKRHLKGDPILARPISRAGRIMRKAFKHRAMLIPSASAVLLGMLLAASSLARRESKMVPMATLESVQGEVLVTNETGEGPARASQLLSSGQGLKTGKGSSWAVLTFPDGSRIEVSPETTIGKLAPGNTVHLAKGSLRAEVVRQQEDHPMILATDRGEVRVIGATFRMAATSGIQASTRLEVVEGSVQFLPPEGALIVVPAGSSVVASPGSKPTLTTIPTDELAQLAREGKTLTGTRRLVNRKSGKALAVQRASRETGACIIQRTYGSDDTQLWRLQTAGDDVYRIENVGSGKALDMLGGGGGGGGDGTQVIQSVPIRQPHQQWRILSVGGGYFRVTNSKSGKALSVLGKSTDEDAYVVQWEYDGDPSQQWLLERP